MTDDNRARMIELWANRLRATSDFERGYYQGRFEEFASQNAIDPELFPPLRAEALKVIERAREPIASRKAPEGPTTFFTDDSEQGYASVVRDDAIPPYDEQPAE